MSPDSARIPLPVVTYWRLPSQLSQERVAVLYLDDSPAWVVAKAFTPEGYSRVAVHESTTDKRHGSNTVSLLDGDDSGFLEVVRDNGVATDGPGTEDGAW